ncbi:hypothetical protein [Aliikangiella sp. G2MR2-5]|uniref:hypothetical protein n=1 Tax=Aliikangiella sp. G2MR2-5 TaxID=2788943 RepID=UPI0018AB63DD|nr:hypothetical protein [Aliikangiella sp. G2MR2-5]
MDFEEAKNESHEANVRKNRATLIALFAIFFVPVIIAYSAYFTGWFNKATENRGQLLIEKDVLDIEDFEFVRDDGKTISGKEFETLYWWVFPADEQSCDQACIELNVFMIKQTHLGLGKEIDRLNPLLVLRKGSGIKTEQFPVAYSEFTNKGVKPLAQTRSGLNKELEANYIYLVDPLGNIMMRYELVKSKDEAPSRSKDLRIDIQRLFKYSRLG